MANINFSDIKIYLDAIANKSSNDIGNSPHDRFWNISYNDFVTGNIPHVKCNGNSIPIVNPDKNKQLESSFYIILTDPNGFCGKRQMPGGGPFITDVGYQVTLPDGRTLTGQQMQDDIKAWLLNGLPETLITT